MQSKAEILELILKIRAGEPDASDALQGLSQARQWLESELEELTKLLEAVQHYEPRIKQNPEYMYHLADRARLRR